MLALSFRKKYGELPEKMGIEKKLQTWETGK